ncbi:hypothetical protein T265_14981, partial [Opisthorchis viverrini]
MYMEDGPEQTAKHMKYLNSSLICYIRNNGWVDLVAYVLPVSTSTFHWFTQTCTLDEVGMSTVPAQDNRIILVYRLECCDPGNFADNPRPPHVVSGDLVPPSTRLHVPLSPVTQKHILIDPGNFADNCTPPHVVSGDLVPPSTQNHQHQRQHQQERQQYPNYDMTEECYRPPTKTILSETDQRLLLTVDPGPDDVTISPELLPVLFCLHMRLQIFHTCFICAEIPPGKFPLFEMYYLMSPKKDEGGCGLSMDFLLCIFTSLGPLNGFFFLGSFTDSVHMCSSKGAGTIGMGMG